MDPMPVAQPNRRGPGCTARRVALVAVVGLLGAAGCGREQPVAPAGAGAPPVRPSILLVTLDTTRADAIGPDAVGVSTPAFNAIAARGQRFRQAYAPVPETLPSHASMMTGLYPAGHGLHENARYLPPSFPVAAERLRAAGYRTAAFVSTFALARRFGLARGFEVYNDEQPAGRGERTALETTDAVLAQWPGNAQQPLFLWVHYYDPHYPYTPPEPLRRQYAGKPYLGEVAFMDAQLGRLVQAFEQRTTGPAAIIIVGDHGEGLGDHGEALHGNLLYQSTMRVPLVIVGPGVGPGVSDSAVSIRRVCHTILDWAGIDSVNSLRGVSQEVVLGEAMKPYLEYGWQPQTMAVEGRHKSILAGRIEMYDVAADPAEVRDLANDANRPLVPAALRDYPVPSPAAARAPDALDADARRTLASLGYVSAGAAPVVRRDAPRPADMVKLYEVLERASDLFVKERYAAVIPLLEQILAADSYNLDAMLRLATAHSALGHDQRAVEMFQRAAAIAPQSQDVKTYLALHYARGPQWARAVPLLEQVVGESPDRLPAVEALAVVRERQGRVDEAISLRQRIYAARAARPAELVQLGQLAMDVGQTAAAIEAFERARALDNRGFRFDLELGVLYLASREFEKAREALDRVGPSDARQAMALFKRAQVSVLLNEPDRASRIAAARRGADATTRELIAKERLFQNVRRP